jgi:hypothetical protein
MCDRSASARPHAGIDGYSDPRGAIASPVSDKKDQHHYPGKNEERKSSAPAKLK